MVDLISFDCYGTLIDMDLRTATKDIFGERLRERRVDPDEFYDDSRAMRFQAVLQPYRPYKDILKDSLVHVARMHTIEYRDEDGQEFLERVRTLAPFDEVPEALRELGKQYKLAIISNSDEDLIVHNVKRLEAEFDYVITAEAARAYKPNWEAFTYLYKTVGRDPEDTIHVAQGFEYDIVPTFGRGPRRIWINRHGLVGSDRFAPYEELTDMSSLPDLLAK